MPGELPTTYSVTVPAEPDGLEHIHDVVDRARADWPDIASVDFDMIETAVIELAGNVARHGRPSGATDMTFTLQVELGELQATLVDAGRPFDIDVDAVSLPDDLDEAGRGIAMARMAVDELVYQHDDGHNTWHLRRFRS